MQAPQQCFRHAIAAKPEVQSRLCLLGLGFIPFRNAFEGAIHAEETYR
ncbi:hypothetical protein BDE40_3414 [Litoreibacter halocynthiae]|uniref:Uncharacterized protein n=1 Tax=Litoreibacter halocynthiae TaxID=1242689 RepID=A0A4R7LCI2_9RHOB|nr:hypothetical protein BDE40_3414 [Litoreibacter halocynthiae]